jgi:transcriptional regulator with XRE-family HTH domain
MQSREEHSRKNGEAHSPRALNEWRKQRLSERLRVLMDQKGLSGATAAKLVQELLPGGSFNPANISHYRAGRSLPRPTVLKALSAVLDVDPEDLAPSQASDAAALAILDEDNEEILVGGVALQDDPTSAAEFDETTLSSIPEFRIKDLPGGEALLQINQRLSWPTVIRILQALKGDNSNKV